MSNTKHTTEPWANGSAKLKSDGADLLLDYGHYNAHLGRISTIAEDDIAIAAHIAACVNACVGIDNETLLDDGVRKMREDRDQLLKQLTETQQALELAQASNKRLQEYKADLLRLLERVLNNPETIVECAQAYRIAQVSPVGPTVQKFADWYSKAQEAIARGKGDQG